MSCSSIVDRQQIGIREVAIVVRFFLAAHRPRLFAVGVEEPRLLHDFAAAFDELDLPRGFDLDRFLDEPERVQVLELRARAELRLAAPAHRNVRVATERAFLHVAVADLEVADERVNLAHVGAGFGRRAQIGRGHDLEQAACRRDSGRCPTCRRSPRAATCRRPPRDARAMIATVRVLPSSSTTSTRPPCTIGSSYWLI